MKPYIYAVALMASITATAQDTYINHHMTCTTDLFGTARFVGMGGALGALGADISCISLNPAGIGLYRRSDIAFTAGFVTQADKNTFGEQPTRGSFDQIGGVFSFNIENGSMKYFNFAVNYQKKADFRHIFIGDCRNTAGTSITDQILNITDFHGYDIQEGGDFTMPSTLSAALFDAYAIDADKDGNLYNPNLPDGNTEFMSTTSGGVHAFDINFSANHYDRFYWGLTFGIDYLRFKENTYFTEFGQPENLDLQTWKQINGVGVNAKLGFIARPFEDSPLRVGVTIETPTRYTLKMDASDDVQMWYENDGKVENTTYSHYTANLDYNLISPWRFRASIGCTAGKWLAVGVDYEYALYNRTKVTYGDTFYDSFYDEWNTTDKDTYLNKFTNETLLGVHSVRAGAEVKLGKHLALRAGYNFQTNAFRPGAYLAHDASVTTMDVATTTHYTNTSEVNIATLGLGYKFKKAYFDVTYKYRNQSGQFYAYENTMLPPVKLNLDTHQVFLTIGHKF